jgi:hypothetical protein
MAGISFKTNHMITRPFGLWEEYVGGIKAGQKCGFDSGGAKPITSDCDTATS